MTNEQFALQLVSEKFSTPSDVLKIAERYYEWLESKKPKSVEVKHYLNGVELPESYWDQLDK
jgi:hypothetical protein